MGDRARKSGIGAQIEKKMEESYDREEEAGTTEAIMLWINAVVAGDHESIGDSSFKKLSSGLRDGVMLCKLANKLLESEGKPAIKFSKKCVSPFVARTNIENFNKGCDAYGLVKEFQVQTDDLYEGRKGPFVNVINCLHSLGMLANGKGHDSVPTYTGQVVKTIDM